MGDQMRKTKSGSRPSSDQVLELWRQYKETGDQRAKDRLILTLAPMVKYIVHKKIREVPARCEMDDFLSLRHRGADSLDRSVRSGEVGDA